MINAAKQWDAICRLMDSRNARLSMHQKETPGGKNTADNVNIFTIRQMTIAGRDGLSL